jgi:hypothetical protein
MMQLSSVPPRLLRQSELPLPPLHTRLARGGPKPATLCQAGPLACLCLARSMSFQRVTTEAVAGAHQLSIHGRVSFPFVALLGALADAPRATCASSFSHARHFQPGVRLSSEPFLVGGAWLRGCCFGRAHRRRGAGNLTARVLALAEHSWRLDVYPGGYDAHSAGCVSVCLELASSACALGGGAAPDVLARHELALCDAADASQHVVEAAGAASPPCAVRRGCVAPPCFATPAPALS